MNAIAKQSTAPMRAVLTPQTFDQLMIFADTVANSDLVPKDYKGKPANVVVAVQMGSELGLQPMQALTSIAVINGRPGVWGDGLIGLCRQSPLCEDIREWFEGEGDERAAFCEAKRRGASPTTARFSVADAKRAGLWGKNIWQQYPDRMLQNRARGFALRDAFPDLLRGLKTVEELRDYPDGNEMREVQATVVEDRPAPPKPAPRPAAPTIDQALHGDDIPDFDAPAPPKPDRLRKVADRIKEKFAEVSNQDAYNEIMSHTGILAEWDKIRSERPELDTELEETRVAALGRITQDEAA